MQGEPLDNPAGKTPVGCKRSSLRAGRAVEPRRPRRARYLGHAAQQPCLCALPQARRRPAAASEGRAAPRRLFRLDGLDRKTFRVAFGKGRAIRPRGTSCRPAGGASRSSRRDPSWPARSRRDGWHQHQRLDQPPDLRFRFRDRALDGVKPRNHLDIAVHHGRRAGRKRWPATAPAV